MATAEFSKFAGILSTALSQHYLLGFEIAQLEFHHLVSIYHNINGNPKSRLPKVMLKSSLGKRVTLFFFPAGIQALDNDSRSEDTNWFISGSHFIQC